MTTKTVSTVKKWLEKHGHYAHFTHRSTMKRVVRARATLPSAERAVPATSLPVDCTGGATVSCPMDANDRFGICGPAMGDHVDGIRTYGQGKPGFVEIHANLDALIAQYEQVSGGDNGTDEVMLVGPGGIWMTGLAGDPTAVVVDHLDVDITNVPLAHYCIDQFYALCMAWSVPADFLKNFATGTKWTAAAIPDPNNGHYTPLSDVSADELYTLFTWGGYAFVGQAFVESVQPECFVTFSALQFNKATGYDSHGRHVSTQAAKWVAIGGDAAKVATVVALFPPIPAPAPAPPPGPVVGNGTLAATQLTAVQAAVAGVIDPQDALMEKLVVEPQLQAAIAALGPTS
jgi:hypothetical protein